MFFATGKYTQGETPELSPVDLIDLLQQAKFISEKCERMNLLTRDLRGLEQVLKLMGPLTEEERQLIVLRASKVCWKLIARECKCHRVTAHCRWKKALSNMHHYLDANRI